MRGGCEECEGGEEGVEGEEGGEGVEGVEGEDGVRFWKEIIVREKQLVGCPLWVDPIHPVIF